MAEQPRAPGTRAFDDIVGNEQMKIAFVNARPAVRPRRQPSTSHRPTADPSRPQLPPPPRQRTPFGALFDATLNEALQASHALQATDASYVAKATYPAKSAIASSRRSIRRN